jgi:hypothetical protein
MSPDLFFELTLAIKLAVTAAFVVFASMVAERAGPLVGAMVSTLPISSGPAFVFLALDHDTTFLALTAVTSLAVNAATAGFALIYAIVAQRQRLAVSLPIALGAWLLFSFVIEQLRWNLVGAIAVNAVTFIICIPLSRGFVGAKMRFPRRLWYDVPLRAAMVAFLVVSVVGLSARVGPAVTGILAVFPIVLTSLMLILQPRIGGPATAAVIANTIWGLVGFGAALVVVCITVVPLGATVGLALGLAVSVCWNLMILTFRRRQLDHSARARPSTRS